MAKEETEKKKVTIQELAEEIAKTNQRIDAIVNAISKAKSVKGL